MEGFKPYTFGKSAPAVVITRNGVKFRKEVVDKLESPPYVQLLINKEEKKIAIKGTSADDPYAVPFSSETGGKSGVYWKSKKLLRAICNITGWELNSQSCAEYMTFAAYDFSKNAWIIDLSLAIQII